jgi:hypothetical protein
MPIDYPLTVLPPPSRCTLVQLDPELSREELDFGRVVFLDFDGVLHPQSFTSENRFYWLGNFCDVMRWVDPLHQVPVVISSTWRHYHSLRLMRDAFPPDIAAQLVGVTPYLSIDDLGDERDWTFLGCDPFKMPHRQREIRMWLHAHAPGALWLAIDDRPDYFEPGCQNLFTVPGLDGGAEGGLNSKVAYDLLDRLKNFLGLALQESGPSSHVC